MAQANAAATLKRANDFGTDFAAATLTVNAGANILATHTLTGWSGSNDGNDGLATADAIAVETITGTGTQTADGATLSSGGKAYQLTVDTAANPSVPPADLRLGTTTYINGETSTINSLVARFKA